MGTNPEKVLWETLHIQPCIALQRSLRTCGIQEIEAFGESSGSFEEQVLVSYALDHSVPEEMALAPEVYAGRAHSRSFPWLYEHMDRPVSLQDGACRR